MTGLTDAWSLAKKNVQKAQKAKKKCYDRRAKEPAFKEGERVFVYMPKEKANKAYKIARTFYWPFRVEEVLETGLTVRPINPSQGGRIRVALNRVRRSPDAIPEGVHG